MTAFYVPILWSKNMSIKTFINDLQVGQARRHQNLVAYPLLCAASGALNYLTLDEALKTGRFKVGEISIAGHVPELSVANGLSQPVLLLDGEELTGAKQNRVLNLSIMIPPETDMMIPVSCVESGRWLSPTGLEKIVREKESKAAEYLPCDAYWLLIIVDWMDNAQEQEISVQSVKIASNVFERIIVYKPDFDDILEVWP